jgi:glycosyltransferase involved in cell wall biosynthesis
MMHYHLKSGGVVSVMRDITRALLQFARFEPAEINIFASVDSRRDASAIFDPPIEVTNLPALAYGAEPYRDKAAFLEAADSLALEILRRIDLKKVDAESPHILHAHNISLGKNPTATMAFQRVAQIARQRSLPLWFINQVHDFAENNRPEQMKAFFNCTCQYDPDFARTFMYPNGSNIIYLTINSADVDNLRTLGVQPDRIYLLPDPVDIEKFEQKPIWAEEEWKAEGLPPADHKDILVHKLEKFAASTSQLFDPSLPVLLSPMKVMRRKNNLEALLLIVLFQRLGRRFQLLISLDANSPPDIEYSTQLKALAVSMRLPVLIGFGHRFVSGGRMRRIENGEVKFYSMSDTIGLSKAVLTTSIVEGFGLVYHEAWLCGRPVIGRKIPELVQDFERNGMDFDHMYKRLAVSWNDLPDLQGRLSAAYERFLPSVEEQPQFTEASVKDIIKSKIFHAGGEECVDFAELDVRLQFEMIFRCLETPALADRLIERNPVLAGMLKLLEACPTRLIEKNRQAVRTHYSLEPMARRLEHLFEIGDLVYLENAFSVIPRPENHLALIRKYQDSRKRRLLLGLQEAEGGKYE